MPYTPRSMTPEFERMLMLAINKEVTAITSRVMSGQCPDYPAYKELIGRAKGLEQARELYNTTIKAMDRDEEDEG